MVMLTPPDWLKNEKWETYIDSRGKKIAKVTGRERTPKELLKDWAWLLKNSYEQQYFEDPRFHPELPDWQRKLMWDYYRNPLQNARLFLWGWADRNYTVEVLEGNPEPFTVQRNDVVGPDGKAELGYQRTKLTLLDGSESRTFTSYCGEKWVWYYGTQPTGIYGAKFNKHKASGGLNDDPRK